MNTGLRYRIHGDFYIDAARKQVGDRAYNKWLAEEVAEFLRLTVLPELIDHYPGDERIVRVMIPVADGDGFAASLQGVIFEELATCRFVPGVEGGYLAPNDVRLAPPGAAVDLEAFQEFFPPEDLHRLYGNRSFPRPEIEQDEEIVEFLKRLGARRLDFGDVFSLLDGRDVVGKMDAYPDFYGFLWRWREKLDLERRRQFSSALSHSHSVVIDDGSWIKPHGRLYHAKLRQETPTMPQPLRTDVVHPSAYDPEGRAGPSHKLLDTLVPSIRDYDAPEIIVNAVIPLFEKGRFQNLSLQERAEVYRYLYAYWETRRGGDRSVEGVKRRVQVPARPITNRRRDAWRPANEAYLSSVWSGDDRLERLYDGFDDVTFLYEVRGLEIPPEERKDWARFWSWLGVNTAPRLLRFEIPTADLWSYRLDVIKRQHPHAGTEKWLEYLAFVRSNHAECKKHGPGYRQLRLSVTVEGFAEMVERRQGERLILMYDLLEDLVDLLRNLPAQYPDPNVAVSSGRHVVSGAIATLSRWVMERTYNLLSQNGSDVPPSPAGSIPLVATEGDVLRYVYPPEPVFFGDDRYHTARWRDHLPFVSLDKNWRSVAEYLGIRPISKSVEESCVPGPVLEDESSRLELHFKRARPYLLAVVSDQRESETENVARHLSNLQIRVVESLVVHRSLKVSPGKALIDSNARVYLEETIAERIGSAGRAPRAGILYICKESKENYDLLAGPLAEYIRIPGLADAFVILLDRGGKDGRMCYLQTRGVGEEHVQEMRDLLSRSGGWEELEQGGVLDTGLRRERREAAGVSRDDG